MEDLKPPIGKMAWLSFLTRGKGFGSQMTYEVVYYSPNDTPLGFQGTDAEFVPHESGWMWQEEHGDNWEYTEKITDHWYWFELYF